MNNIILIGMPGSGKSTVGRLLNIEGFEFIDTDELLEVTPKSLRIRKKILDSRLRKRSNQK